MRNELFVDGLTLEHVGDHVVLADPSQGGPVEVYGGRPWGMLEKHYGLGV